MAAYYTYNFLPPISSDLDSLIHDFERESDYDYQTFASVWQKHKLEFLFKAADIQPNSFRFFLDDSMTVAASYLGQPWRLPIQLGALYCLFTIYMYQIEEPKIKIRLPIDTLNSFLDQMELSSAIPADAKTILCKLIHEHAFVISATRHEMGPRFFTKMNYMKSGKYMRSDVLLSSRLNIDEKLITMCEEAHNLYTKAKDNLIEASGGTDSLPQELTSIRPNFIEQLKKEFDLERSDDQFDQEEQPDTEPEPIPQRGPSIGETRSRIRAKAEMIAKPKASASVKEEYTFDDDHDDYNNDDDADECSLDMIADNVNNDKRSAKRAGQIIRDVQSSGTGLDIVEKGHNDPQTKADRASQQLIISSLVKHFPQLTVRGEENIPLEKSAASSDIDDLIGSNLDEILKAPCPTEFQKLEEKDLVIWVDPLDGTREFTEGRLEGVTVLIGVATQGNAIGGIIHQPFYEDGGQSGRSIWGLVHAGVYGKCDINKTPLPGRIVAGSLSHRSKTVIDAVNACQPTEVLQAGGCGYKSLLVLERRVHVYVHASRGCSLWDTCAPEAILRAAGGRLTDVFGNGISYFPTDQTSVKTGVLATMADHDWYAQQIREKINNL
ncbi:unnamed protein product [Adineta ricciae]|uniref:3'(2'),5'-bisphosphate nucleotidase 1 n=1 Tax=Adineta ricciae TaxID=249248 RepID=A0A814NBE5_ADIRI|nr:unnamed protein product [Adineta ricciae]CAF1089202.1 unnamed protein product [Adineta ricciae]